MSSSEISPFPAFRPAVPFEPAAVRTRPRVWLHVLLLLATLFTTTVVGARMQHNFDHNLPFFDIDRDLGAFLDWREAPASLVAGLPFSLTLLVILLAHECGHYIACLYYGVDASLPYFLPAPTFTGTLGAFIRIRTPIYSKRTLFDVGIAGPIAGFVFLLPALTVGLAMSKIVPGIAHAGSITFGTPALLRFFEMLIFPGIAGQDIYLHPVARAGWIGLFATALNLLPVGQLDGGHILYAVVGDKHRIISRIFLCALVPLGLIYWYGWLVWATLLFIFGRKHPSIYDLTELDGTRYRLGALALAMFVVCFMFAPVS